MVVLAVFAFLLPAYAISAFNMDGIFGVHAIVAITLFAFEAMGEFLGVAIMNPLVGMLGMVCSWFCAFLFCGAFLKPEFIVWPFRLTTYIFPLRWAFRGMFYLETTGTIFDGAVEDINSPTGFRCPNLSPMECVGYTGDQVRKSMTANFGVLSEEDTVAEDFLFIAIICVVWKCLAILMITLKTAWVTPLKPKK
jgi:hypothetical protein